MHDIYLTEIAKQFYTDALNHVRNCADEFWGLDTGLDKYLDLINSGPHVAPMYSKYGPSSLEGRLISYVIVCYSRDIEKIIIEDIPKELKQLFDSHEVSLCLNQPKIQDKKGVTNPCLKYVSHPEYWNVNHFRYELITSEQEHHNVFWEYISNRLSRL